MLSSRFDGRTELDVRRSIEGRAPSSEGAQLRTRSKVHETSQALEDRRRRLGVLVRFGSEELRVDVEASDEGKERSSAFLS